jgi:uncharacterized membrane protein
MKIERILSAFLLLALLASIAALIYLILNPLPGERFTEFYILGPKGKASDYPTRLFVNQSGSLIIGIVNHEYRTMNYTVEIWRIGENFSEIRLLESFTVSLEHSKISEQWKPQFERNFSFSIEKPGEYRLVFLLLKDCPPKRPEDYGSEEERIRKAISGELQSLILNVEVLGYD